MGPAPTPSQTVGPYYAIGLCRRPDNELAEPNEPGALVIAGQLLDGEGVPIADGMIEVWQATIQRWGRCGTHPDGRFSFVLEKPPAGDGEAPRLDVYVHARGLLKHQLTRMYFPDEDEANAGDPVLAALEPDDRATLVSEQEDDGTLRFDIRLQGPRQTVFFAV